LRVSFAHSIAASRLSPSGTLSRLPKPGRSFTTRNPTCRLPGSVFAVVSLTFRILPAPTSRAFSFRLIGRVITASNTSSEPPRPPEEQVGSDPSRPSLDSLFTDAIASAKLWRLPRPSQRDSVTRTPSASGSPSWRTRRQDWCNRLSTHPQALARQVLRLCSFLQKRVNQIRHAQGLSQRYGGCTDVQAHSQ
jgi:hypothetical protein